MCLPILTPLFIYIFIYIYISHRLGIIIVSRSFICTQVEPLPTKLLSPTIGKVYSEGRKLQPRRSAETPPGTPPDHRPLIIL